jgi:hypothetical protein
MERDKKELARLVGESKSYVKEVMRTTQVERHAVTDDRRIMSDDEARERAARLIEAYARKVP